MTELKTKDTLLKALRNASTRNPSAKEINKQRVSFVVGSLKDKSGISREKIEEMLREQEGARD